MSGGRDQSAGAPAAAWRQQSSRACVEVRDQPLEFHVAAWRLGSPPDHRYTAHIPRCGCERPACTEHRYGGRRDHRRTHCHAGHREHAEKLAQAVLRTYRPARQAKSRRSGGAA
jgi:hypothetical protein